ncbi:hypothetical protein SAVIM40S_05302 [Streptomyces avidinii]
MLLERVRVDREGSLEGDRGQSDTPPVRGATFRVRAPQGQHAAFLHHFPARHAASNASGRTGLIPRIRGRRRGEGGSGCLGSMVGSVG